MPFDAFISYSHAADGKLAPTIQRGLHRFAKSLFSLRALRIFRDKTNLAVNPELWGSIVSALDASEYFILLASPESAKSKWVHKEAVHWIKNKAASKMLIVVTDGTVIWNAKENDFDWSKTNALPPVFKNLYSQEPLYLDLTWAKTSEHLSLRHSAFRNAIAQLAATLHDRPLDDIAGEDVREHRKFVRFVSGGIVALVILAVFSSIAAYLANKNKNEAVRQRFVSISQALAAYALREQEQSQQDERAALLARQAYLFNERHHGDRIDQVDKALRTVLSKKYFSVTLNTKDTAPTFTSIAISHDGQYLAAAGQGKSIYVWKLGQNTYQPVKLQTKAAIIWALVFSKKTNVLAAGTHNGIIELWRLQEVGPPVNIFTIESD